ncbi:eCIS core domain-containing protein [Hyalangium versicolor]|uniref:eCIS core domain-containing protein n=1 Tax=Hyalangium versicolor TaxID=2861190 RepID=UPI001CCB4ECE|nr:DUF4157 domain-containing protein [Hyalangium versicolor]
MQRKCASCAREEELRREADGSSPRGTQDGRGGVPPIVDTVLGTPGRPLDAETRAAMERGFGRDLGAVRIHTDALAGESARAVDALAYTVGNHVVFGAGRYAPLRASGRELLAHELAHVVQQGQGGASVPQARSLSISQPSDPDEREADAIAQRVVAGDVARMGSGSGAGILHRAVRESVVRDFLPNPRQARACLIHVHGDEQNAFQSATELRRTHCVNFVHLSANSSRYVHIDLPGGGTCEADPNRVFTPAGLASHALHGSCSNSRVARSDLSSFAGSLEAAIRECRLGSGSSGVGGSLPLVAFHNNTIGSGLDIHSYDPPSSPGATGGSESGATERDRSRLTPPGASGPVTNPAVQSGQSPDDFLLTTSLADMRALSTGVPGGSGRRYNTVLQSTAPTDDGSLSVAVAQQAAAANAPDRYINVEAGGKRFRPATTPRGGGTPVPSAAFVNNLQMGLDVLTLLGVPRQPCDTPGSAPAQSSPPASGEGPRLMRQVDGGTPAEERAGMEEQPEGLLERIIRLIRLILDALDETSRLPAPAPRDPVPPSTDTCRTFADSAALDARKASWSTQLAGMAIPDVVQWIIGMGSGSVFTAARSEARAQMDCLLAALEAAAGRTGSGISVPGGRRANWVVGAAGQWGYRDFTSQRRIWERKFDFRVDSPTSPVMLSDRNPNAFDRISARARRTCGSLLGSELKWNPENPAHRLAWGAAALPGTTPPAMPARARSLTADERQREILEASSAPGISRHHWGTDVDLLSVEPGHWAAGTGRFAGAYSWLRANASTYGFIQSFTPLSAVGGLGYMAEQWHWSYYPVAQALLDFARAHLTDIEGALQTQWGSAPQFSYIRQHWQQFMFNVHQRPTPF